MESGATATERFSVRSRDGVDLAVTARGQGPALLLVYGALMEQGGWARLLPHIQAGRRVYTYDRRGRGASGDAPSYAVEGEVEDLLCVTVALPGPVDLFAHSSGAVLALEALAGGLEARRAVLYEPLVGEVREPRLPSDLPERIRALLDAGDREGALEVFLREGMELAPEDVERLRGGPRWQEQLGYVRSVYYDVSITRGFVLRPERLAAVSTPVLVLVGGDSPGWMHRGAEMVAAALPRGRVELLARQGHNAQFAAPEVLGAAVRRFLETEG